MYSFLGGLRWHVPGLSELCALLETRYLLQVEPGFFDNHLACHRFTALPPQRDPSQAEVPQALAVGFQVVETSTIAYYL